ncbi:hypothetical protein BJV77DRAFT_1005658 [Russula vinacea]|nr:hypothetical protein BJV77DRAFT_1005658 [Russula vinacea]
MYATRVLAHYFLFLFFGFHISTYTEVVLKVRGKPTVQRSTIQKLWFLELTVDYYCLGLAVHHTSQCYVVVYGTLLITSLNTIENVWGTDAYPVIFQYP